ncbi:MAG: DUF488 family protein [Dehalococcoidia bacterium]
MLYTASFYAPGNWVGSVYRVSRQHPRGRKTQWGTLPFLYPDRELLRAYRAGEIDFGGLGEAYTLGLDTKYEDWPEFRDWLESVPDLGDFTLLCFEARGEPCHRLVLARWLLERVPGLEAGQLR